ncbi:MAG: hypothetical protein R3A48_18960 [Polyangiales bacterium]
MSDRAVNDNVMVMYGLLAGGARLLLPPIVDLPVVRVLRTAMVERLARAHGVTLTAGARRILVDIEQASTIRGNVTQGFRWAVERLVPGGRFFDAGANLFRTWGTGVLLHRYLSEHRASKDPVLSEIEAERVRAGLRAALVVLDNDQARAFADEVMLPMRTADDARGLSRLERWGEAAAATVAELPVAWLDAAERTFVETVQKYR